MKYIKIILFLCALGFWSQGTFSQNNRFQFNTNLLMSNESVLFPTYSDSANIFIKINKNQLNRTYNLVAHIKSGFGLVNRPLSTVGACEFEFSSDSIINILHTKFGSTDLEQPIEKILNPIIYQAPIVQREHDSYLINVTDILLKSDYLYSFNYNSIRDHHGKDAQLCEIKKTDCGQSFIIKHFCGFTSKLNNVEMISGEGLLPLFIELSILDLDQDNLLGKKMIDSTYQNYIIRQNYIINPYKPILDTLIQHWYIADTSKITVYIDHRIPTSYQQIIKSTIQQWNQLFFHVGYKNFFVIDDKIHDHNQLMISYDCGSNSIQTQTCCNKSNGQIYFGYINIGCEFSKDNLLFHQIDKSLSRGDTQIVTPDIAELSLLEDEMMNAFREILGLKKSNHVLKRISIIDSLLVQTGYGINDTTTLLNLSKIDLKEEFNTIKTHYNKLLPSWSILSKSLVSSLYPTTIYDKGKLLIESRNVMINIMEHYTQLLVPYLLKDIDNDSKIEIIESIFHNLKLINTGILDHPFLKTNGLSLSDNDKVNINKSLLNPLLNESMLNSLALLQYQKINQFNLSDFYHQILKNIVLNSLTSEYLPIYNAFVDYYKGYITQKLTNNQVSYQYILIDESLKFTKQLRDSLLRIYSDSDEDQYQEILSRFMIKQLNTILN